MNKFISSLAAIALVITSVVISPVQAANIAANTILVNNSATASIAVNTQITTIKFTPTTALVNANTITVGYDSNIVDTGLVTGDIAVTDAGTDGVYATSAVNTATKKITITVTGIGASGADQVTLAFSNSHFATPAAGAMLSFTVTTNSDIGANLIPVANYNQVSVTATVDPVLTFSLGANTIALGTLSSTATNSGSHTLSAASNASSGYVVALSGATLTKVDEPGETITAIGTTAAASAIGTEQFGINLKDNATPNVGAEAVGGTGVALAPYATVDQFAFDGVGANTIANSATAPSGNTNFTVSYIANISAATAAGSYGTTLTYTITPTF